MLDKLGVDFAPDTPVAALSLAQRQLLEIAKALSLDARLVIMDEPTSSLTLAETERAPAVQHLLHSLGWRYVDRNTVKTVVKLCLPRWAIALFRQRKRGIDQHAAEVAVVIGLFVRDGAAGQSRRLGHGEIPSITRS